MTLSSSALSPEDRLDAAFKVAGEAFKKTTLTMKDIEHAVRSVGRKAYEKNLCEWTCPFRYAGVRKGNVDA